MLFSILILPRLRRPRNTPPRHQGAGQQNRNFSTTVPLNLKIQAYHSHNLLIGKRHPLNRALHQILNRHRRHMVLRLIGRSPTMNTESTKITYRHVVSHGMAIPESRPFTLVQCYGNQNDVARACSPFYESHSECRHTCVKLICARQHANSRREGRPGKFSFSQKTLNLPVHVPRGERGTEYAVQIQCGVPGSPPPASPDEMYCTSHQGSADRDRA